MPVATSRPQKLLLLGLLYFTQGLPFGFQATALPVYLRGAGVDLKTLGFLSALALPWLLKALWAPLVDRFYWPRVGRRRSWILPMQLGLGVTALLAATLDPETQLNPLLGLVFLMNLFAATQDIAVDGLAVDLLKEEELGPGNAAQVVGYKVGMLTGGGLLVAASDLIGWSGLFVAIGALVLGVMAFVAWAGEPALPGLNEKSGGVSGGAMVGDAPPRGSLKEVVGKALGGLGGPGMGWLVVVILTYKLGESMADTMFKPFLVDSGITAPEIGILVGTFGMVASLVGSLAGGIMASKVAIPKAVFIAVALRSASMLGEVYLGVVGVGPVSLPVVIALESFFGGALTTTIFALMMSRVSAGVGATQFTILASIEVLGKFPGSMFSGVIAEALGYVGVFALGTALSFGVLPLVWPLVRGERLGHEGA